MENMKISETSRKPEKETPKSPEKRPMENS